VVRQSRTQSIGNSGQRVRLVNHQWNACAPGGEIGRSGGISAESDNDLDLATRNECPHLSDSPGKTPRKAQRGHRQASRERHTLNGDEFVTALWNESSFEALRRPQDDDGGCGFTRPKCIGRCQQGIDVTGGSATREKEDGHQ
jgi:hypothetical protein